MRIAAGGILHETNTFAAGLTDWPAFEEDGAFPGLRSGPAVIEDLQETGLAIAGFIAGALEAGVEPAPLIWTFAQPSGIVRHEVYLRLRRMLLERLQSALPVDGVFLDLHGAMVTEECDDAEGDLLQAVRRLTGPDVPVVAGR